MCVSQASRLSEALTVFASVLLTLGLQESLAAEHFNCREDTQADLAVLVISEVLYETPIIHVWKNYDRAGGPGFRGPLPHLQ